MECGVKPVGARFIAPSTTNNNCERREKHEKHTSHRHRGFREIKNKTFNLTAKNARRTQRTQKKQVIAGLIRNLPRAGDCGSEAAKTLRP